MVRKDAGGEKIWASERIRGCGFLVGTGNDTAVRLLQSISQRGVQFLATSHLISPHLLVGSDPEPWRMPGLSLPHPSPRGF